MELEVKIDLLDHGYLKFIESWGSDERIIEAARMSTNKGFEGWGPKLTYRCPDHGMIDNIAPIGSSGSPSGSIGQHYHIACGKRIDKIIEPGDEKLLAYLWNNRHATPFEMAGLIVEVQAPILVFREWHRHRTQSYNEMSARYTPLPDLNYIPTVERLMMHAGGSNKQAGTVKGSDVLDEVHAEVFRDSLKSIYAEAQRTYEWALAHGVPKELARVHLPVGRYSRMRASANLRNWLAFCTLRQDPKAQWEIRQYANGVGDFLQALFPRTYELFLGTRGF